MAVSECFYPLDKKEDSYHVGVFFKEEIIGVASIFHEDQDGSLGTSSWRIRGMAMDKKYQSKGLGSSMLKALIDYALFKKATSIWCNARTTAKEFYERQGLLPIGEEFELPGIGPHFIHKMEVNI